MNEFDQKWIKWLVLGAAAGTLVGEIIYRLLIFAVQYFGSAAADSVHGWTFSLLVPAGFIVGVLIVLYLYTKDKNDE